MTTSTILQTAWVGATASTLTLFLEESIQAMVPWLVVMLSVILCDLVVALRRCYIMNEEIRVSKAVRNTMGKVVTYVAFVLMVCLIEQATGFGLHLDAWSCLIVCFTEACSIFSNLLKPHGYKLNTLKAVAVLVAKLTGVEKQDVEETVEKTAE